MYTLYISPACYATLCQNNRDKSSSKFPPCYILGYFFESLATTLGYKLRIKIGWLLGYFSAVFVAITSNKSGNPPVLLSSCLGLGLGLEMGSWFLNCALSRTVLIKLYVGDHNAYWLMCKSRDIGSYTLQFILCIYLFTFSMSTAQVQSCGSKSHQANSSGHMHVLFKKIFSM